MSGGIAYVFDDSGDFTENRCNTASVDLEPLTAASDIDLVHTLTLRHLHLTGSPRAAWILENWSELLPRFIKVFPHEYKRVLGVSRVNEAYIPAVQIPSLMTVGQVQHG
jgi:glutamate synthase (NADPH/NADH) large chain